MVIFYSYYFYRMLFPIPAAKFGIYKKKNLLLIRWNYILRATSTKPDHQLWKILLKTHQVTESIARKHPESWNKFAVGFYYVTLGYTRLLYVTVRNKRVTFELDVWFHLPCAPNIAPFDNYLWNIRKYKQKLFLETAQKNPIIIWN